MSASNETKINQMLQILVSVCIGFIVFAFISRYFNAPKVHNNKPMKRDKSEQEEKVEQSANYSDIAPVPSSISDEFKEKEEEEEEQKEWKPRTMRPRRRNKWCFPNFGKERSECNNIISYWCKSNGVKKIISKDLYRMITRYYILYVYGDDRGDFKIYDLNEITRLYIRSRTGIASIGSNIDNIGSDIGFVRDIPLKNKQRILSISGTVCWMHHSIYLTQITIRTNVRCYHYGGNDNFFNYKFIPYYTFLIDAKNAKKGLKRLIVYYEDVAISGIWAD